MPYTDEQLCEIAAGVLRTNRYLTLATCAASGVPWAAPLMYAVDQEEDFYWTSATDAVHSRQLIENPQVALVIFDSNPTYGSAQALYCAGRAAELAGTDLQKGCEVFYTMRYPDPEERRAKGRTPKDFEADSPRRMYRAVVSEYSILHPDKHPVHGSVIDHRVVIPFSSAMR